MWREFSLQAADSSAFVLSSLLTHLTMFAHETCGQVSRACLESQIQVNGVKTQERQSRNFSPVLSRVGGGFCPWGRGSLTLRGQPTAENADTVVASPVCPLLVYDE